jgi:membrane-bound serine protease (ClpP class)
MQPLTLAFLLIVIGLLMLVAELFVPSGVFFALSLAGIGGGVAMTFLYSNDSYTGWLTLLVVFIVVPALGGLVIKYWPRTPMGRRFFLQQQTEDDATIASMPVNVELEQLRGRFGRTLSPLRPAGVVDFDGRRIDTITEGMMVDADQWVRCIDVKAGKVIVRPAAKPRLDDLDGTDFE